MTFKEGSFLVWVGGSCDYGHKERAGAGACIIERDGKEVRNFELSEFGTTEFRMMLSVMIKTMEELPENSDIVFLTNVSYIQNYDKTPTAGTSNADLITKCISLKSRHNSTSVKIVPFHKYKQLIMVHENSHLSMDRLRRGI